MKEDDVSRMIIGAAIEVHRQLGPGLLESVYQQCLAKELELQDIKCKCEVPVRAEYKGLEFDVAYRMDMLVQDIVAVELKVAEKIQPVHESQLLSYLKLSGIKLGLLLNFNEPVLKHGIKRVVNNL